jgi:hypothetical protein
MIKKISPYPVDAFLPNNDDKTPSPSKSLLNIATAANSKSLINVANVASKMSARVSIKNQIRTQTLKKVRNEIIVKKIANIAEKEENDSIGDLSVSDHLLYQIENRISSNPTTPFTLLGLLFIILFIIYGIVWKILTSYQGDDAYDPENIMYGADSYSDSFFVSLLVLTSGGYEDGIPEYNGLRIIYFAMILTGMVVFAILVGFITDSIQGFMSSLSEGRSKCCEADHTLILGWNEATIRFVVQTAFLRRQYQLLNESKFFGIIAYLPILKVPFEICGLLERPSTSLSCNDIVILSNLISKEEMHLALEHAFDERGIDPQRTKIGQNVICRIGDPTNLYDLQNVGAHRASAIITMMTDEDTEEEDQSDGQLQNGATMRVAMALRHVIFTNDYTAGINVNPDLRVVLQLTKPSIYIDALCFKNEENYEVIMPVDLSAFLNSIMFSCATQPGLANILLSLLDFEGCCLRRRIAKNLKSGPDNEYGGCVGRTFFEMTKQFENATMVGILRSGMTNPDEIRRRGFGLCPDPDIIIEEDDLLVFIGKKSTPVRSSVMVALTDSYDKDADLKLAMIKEEVNADLFSLRTMIMCGWRKIWSMEPQRFKKRIEEASARYLPGSNLIFLNNVSKESFAEIMSICELTKNPIKEDMWDLNGGVSVIHKFGDATSPEILEPIVIDYTINTAIVLGTQAESTLPARSRDTRVLSIMLLLRKIYTVKGENVALHIVGENQEDMTAQLALSPLREGLDGEEICDAAPDFINTQAIYARTLCLTMAFPKLQPILNDIFEEGEGSTNLEIVAAVAYIPLNKLIKWGTCKACVDKEEGERTILLGVIHSNGDVKLNPHHSLDQAFLKGDRFIVFRKITN